ncbi:Internalin-A precursor [Streptomyces sp. ADI97-07]|nr:Internalin-A precursor [Streptomyces sp. ADI97-07]
MLLKGTSPSRALEAVGELIILSDTSEALPLAAELAETAELSHGELKVLWPTAADPDGYCAMLLAPALVREGVTDLSLYGMTSLCGLRHLTMLRTLTVFRCKEVTDLTELAALTDLVELDLDGCAGVHDLAPLSGLTSLTTLGLHRCRAVEDTRPLLTLRKLQDLDLSMTKVRSAAGFGAAFLDLRRLNLQGCRSFKNAHDLSGLGSLTDLNLGWTGVRDLDGLSGVGAVDSLDLTSCKRLTSLKGIDAMPLLTELQLEKCSWRSAAG